jgi:plastocyanin
MLAGGVLALAVSVGLVEAAGASAQMIETSGVYSFSPAKLTVSAGTAVTWTNASDAMHTVTADDGSFASPLVKAGAIFSHTFASAGTFAIHCTVHSYMHGTVVVLAAGQALPPTDATQFGVGSAPSRALPLALLLIGGLTLLVAAGLARLRHRAN